MEGNAIPKKTNLVIIGAGPGGYTAAFRAVELGQEVTLIDPELNPGGVCLYRGCIPSKALLHAAGLINETAESSAIGITFSKPKIDLERIRNWKNEVIKTLTSALGKKVDKLKITAIRGMAKFIDEHTLEIKLSDGQQEILAFEQAILATGSSPMMLSGQNNTSKRVWDSSGALEINSVPNSLLVVGGGYIGLELGSVYAAFGSKVAVAELTDGLLPGCDRDLVSVLKRRLDKKFNSIMLNTRVESFKEQKNGLMVTFMNQEDETSKQLFENVLVAIGRRPNTQNLGLENTSIKLDEKGFIEVDAQMRTAHKHIFAIGDIAGEPMLAHKAYAEANVAVEAAVGKKTVFDPRAIPAVVFTDPEIAWCGLTENDARARKIKVKTAKFPWRGNGRTLTLARDDGMTKIIIDPETDRILGVGMVGPGAGELIAEAVVAIEMAAVNEDLRRSIHPHPTLSETIFEAAEMFSNK